MSAQVVPRRRPPGLMQRLAFWLLALFDWRVDIEWPPEAHGVIIVYPHTSNWDFPIGFLAQMQAEFRRRPWMWLAITPEGTRSRTEYWKSGFYHLARAANVPVGLAFIDFGRKVVGLRDYMRMTGDIDADLAAMRAVYADKVAKRPEHAGAIRFSEEAEARLQE